MGCQVGVLNGCSHWLKSIQEYFKEFLSMHNKKRSASGNRTPVSRVTGGDTHHYTNVELFIPFHSMYIICNIVYTCDMYVMQVSIPYYMGHYGPDISYGSPFVIWYFIGYMIWNTFWNISYLWAMGIHTASVPYYMALII